MYSKVIMMLLACVTLPVYATYDDTKPRFNDDILFCILDFDYKQHNEIIASFVNGLHAWNSKLPNDFFQLDHVIVSLPYRFAACDVIVRFNVNDSYYGLTFTQLSTLSGRFFTSITLDYDQYCHVYVEYCAAIINKISMHEIGHVLGLVHDDVQFSIMNNNTNTLTISIQETNINDVLQFYNFTELF